MDLNFRLFETDDERSYLTVILPVQEKFLSDVTMDVSERKTRRSISEIKELILQILSESGEKSTSELAADMGYTKITEAVRKASKELLAEGKIEYLFSG